MIVVVACPPPAPANKHATLGQPVACRNRMDCNIEICVVPGAACDEPSKQACQPNAAGQHSITPRRMCFVHQIPCESSRMTTR